MSDPEEAPLRRRTSLILGWIFIIAMLASLVGTAVVVWRAPAVAAKIFSASVLAGVGLARALGELRWSDTLRTGGILGLCFAAFGMGAYALWAFAGVTSTVVIVVLGGAIGLVLVMLVRALIASGSADYPYDE